MDELDPIARIVWKLARNHTWGQPVPEEAVIAMAAKDENSDEMQASLDAALELSFLSSGPHGVYIPNGQAKHSEAADWLPPVLMEQDLVCKWEAVSQAVCKQEPRNIFIRIGAIIYIDADQGQPCTARRA